MSACPAPGKAEDAELLAEIALGVRSVEAIFLPGLALRWISPSIEALTGFTAADCVAAADPFELLVFEDDRVFCRRMAQRVAAEESAQAFELRLRARDGRAVWVQTHWRPRADGGLRLSAEHIQARKETEFTLLETVAELRRQEALRELYLVRSNDERQRLAALLNLIRLGILFIDHDRRVLYHNRAMLAIWGYPPDAPCSSAAATRCSRSRSRRSCSPIRQGYLAHIHRTGAWPSSRSATSTSSGSPTGASPPTVRRWSKGGEAGRRIGRLWIYEDVTEARRTSMQLVELAERDELTGLYNRRRFHEELGRMLADAGRRGSGSASSPSIWTVSSRSTTPSATRPATRCSFASRGNSGAPCAATRPCSASAATSSPCSCPSGSTEGLCELAHRLVETVGAMRFVFEGRADRASPPASASRAFPTTRRDGEALVAAADEALYRVQERRAAIAADGVREAGRPNRLEWRPSNSDEPASRED
jgi:PAS domain S-box-containing protein